ncbi:hypothetical protein [Pseudochelatococcus sp. G4_1912]|uniref:hypothetical protein n=1 Tax=Pseudochelatococcus sp. G4_1912 TaxID=3114288 RepID=UPI0039C66F3E
MGPGEMLAPDSIGYTGKYNALHISAFRHFRIHFVEEQSAALSGSKNYGIRRKGRSENIVTYPNRTSIYVSGNANTPQFRATETAMRNPQ